MESSKEIISPVLDKCLTFSFLKNKGAFVYFLILENEIVYVGKSNSVFARVGAHTEKQFDTIKYLEVYPEVAHSLELAMIKFLKPRFNKQLGSGFLSEHERDAVASMGMDPSEISSHIKDEYLKKTIGEKHLEEIRSQL